MPTCQATKRDRAADRPADAQESPRKAAKAAGEV